MEMNSLPITLTHTEELKSKLEKEFYSINSLMWAELRFYDGSIKDKIYKKEIAEEEDAIFDLLDRFKEECKSNFLRINDEGLRERYYYLLNNYFSFLLDNGKDIKKHMDEFWKRFDTNHETGFYKSKYYDSINSWANFLTQDVLDEIQEIFDLYNSYGANNILSFRVHKPAIDVVIPEPEIIELEPIEPDQGLSAPQQLLFVRLLQQSDLFPKKPNNTDDAPELRAIALLTGLNYKNDIKGGKGANSKVNQLLDFRGRRLLSHNQIKQKLIDLNRVENVARLLNVEQVIRTIQTIRTDLEEIYKS